MHIGVLSRNRHLYSTSRLVEAAKQRGHAVSVVDYLRCYMDITSTKPRVLLRGEEQRFDAVIPRIGASHTFYGAAVVRQFEMMKVYSASPSQAITRSRDKLHAQQLLARAGVDLPVTGYAHATQDIEGLLDVVGGTPVVVKLLEGTQGLGVVLAETKKAAESVIGAFRQLDANILVQEYIKESRGADVRALVVGGKVVAAMRRTGAPGDFRSNLHRGGSAEQIKLTQAERGAAVKAARTVGLNIAGVDLLQSDRGPLVLEVNSSPGLEGIERTSEVDVADRIIEFIEDNVTKRGRKQSGNTPKA
jgi:ribosomal protein S6--L-glutamate ligase